MGPRDGRPAARRPRWSRWLLLILPLAQGAPPRYTAGALACTAFLEQVQTDIRSQAGGALREERAGRSGILVLRALGEAPLALEGWYDSLVVWREGPEGRTAPDTDGLVGGRWTGRLTPDGIVTPGSAPFVPEEVAEIADLGGVLADFLPRLPPAPGASAPPADGWAIRRLGDAQGAARYAWTLRRRSDTTGMADTVPVPLRREVEEEGLLLWDRQGPRRWERTITVTGRIEAGGAIRRGVRSTVRQRIWVERLPGEGRC